MILDDIRRAIGAARRERAGKRSLGYAEPRLVVLVGNRHAFLACAAIVGDPFVTVASNPIDASAQWSIDGVPVRFGGCIGVDAIWEP